MALRIDASAIPVLSMEHCHQLVKLLAGLIRLRELRAFRANRRRRRGFGRHWHRGITSRRRQLHQLAQPLIRRQCVGHGEYTFTERRALPRQHVIDRFDDIAARRAACVFHNRVEDGRTGRTGRDLQVAAAPSPERR